jgi:lipopolysaccharide export system protein LptA
MIGETRAELRGSRPLVEEPDRRVVADEIDIVTKPSQLTARGSVQTRFVPAARGSSSDAAGPGAATADGAALPFTPGVPVDVLSDGAVIKQDDKTAEFTGHVRARQAERALSSAKLFVNDADKTARAEGSVTVRTFREEKPATAISPPAVVATPPGGVAAKSPKVATGPTGGVVRVPVQIDADSLFRDDVHHLTRFEGHAIYREPSRRLNADRITIEGGSGGAPATTTAEGHVVTDGDGKHGTGDRAVHRAADKTVTLEGTDRPAQVFEAATGRSWRGPSLTWVQTPDSIPVVTGTSGRSRIVGSTGSPRDGVGKPTDRGKPR